VKDHGRERIFIFYAAINTRVWRVLVGSVSKDFSSEWLAGEFALRLAERQGGARMVDVLESDDIGRLDSSRSASALCRGGNQSGPVRRQSRMNPNNSLASLSVATSASTVKATDVPVSGTVSWESPVVRRLPQTSKPCSSAPDSTLPTVNPSGLSIKANLSSSWYQTTVPCIPSPRYDALSVPSLRGNKKVCSGLPRAKHRW